MKTLLWLVIAICPLSIAMAQDDPPSDRDIATRLIQFLRKADKASVAKLVRYPLKRLDPLPPIRNEKEFVQNYEDFFDAETIPRIEAGAKDIWSSWRGTAIGTGLIWIDSGKIIAINLTTNRQTAAATAARASLHPTARNYDIALFTCATKNYQLRIHDEAGVVRYFSWKAGQPLSTKPDLVLTGQQELHGNGGNATYTFKNGDYLYRVDEVAICANDCDSRLIVTRGDRTLLDETCIRKN
jgi:hypothetical protein